MKRIGDKPKKNYTNLVGAIIATILISTTFLFSDLYKDDRKNIKNWFKGIGNEKKTVYVYVNQANKDSIKVRLETKEEHLDHIENECKYKSKNWVAKPYNGGFIAYNPSTQQLLDVNGGHQWTAKPDYLKYATVRKTKCELMEMIHDYFKMKNSKQDEFDKIIKYKE